MEIKARFKKDRWAILAAVIISACTLNLLASRHFGRLDLTAQQLYTLAPATKEVLKNLNDVVVLRLYFTPDLPPALKGIRRDVEDILKEYKTYAGGQVKIEYHNPQENPVEEQKVQMMGIPPIEVNVIEKDKQQVAKIYLGLTVNFESRQEVLAVVQNTGNLEYRLDAAILKVTEPKKPVVGWWGPSVVKETAYTPQQKPEGYELAFDRIEQRHEIRSIAEVGLNKLDPKEISTLLFVVPDKMTEEEKTAFANYIQQGGKAIVLVQPVDVAMGQGLKASLAANPLDDFLKKQGVEVGQNLVLDRSNAMATFSGGLVSFHLPYPYWVMIRPEGFNREQPMVSELTQLVLPWTSALKLSGAAVPLFKTTRFGVADTVNPMLPLDPQMANNAIERGKTDEIVLGALVNDQMVVIGDSRFLQNNFLQMFEANGIFLENAVDVFSTGNKLIGVRSKGMAPISMATVSDTARTVIKFVDIFASPVLLLMAAGIIFWRRRARAKNLSLRASLCNPDTSEIASSLRSSQ